MNSATAPLSTNFEVQQTLASMESLRRHGDPIVLIIEAGAMHAAGFSLFHSGSGVWLTEQTPVAFLEFP